MYSELQDVSAYCDICNVPDDYDNGKMSVDEARYRCSYCRKFGQEGIYKFDIVHALHKRPKFKGKGKTATRTRQYGTAVSQLMSEGRTIREIAKILGISPTTIVKIKKDLSDK